MSLDLAEAPAPVAAPVPAVTDPESRPPARHRQHFTLRALPALADRLWRLPIGTAAVIFASCGPAHSLGYTDYVFNAVLVGLGLSGIALPLGVIGLKNSAADEPAPVDQVPPHPPAGNRE
ncbi:hypothetical protein [Actinoplanes sp. NPDC051859]|uniref:hypothetical protein n=1 Tax=Actinoplanes sp. NPDC051859 TaxID=3363909 RepID=UPI0037A7C277